MRLGRRQRFADVIETQLDLFAEDSARLLADVEAALGAYDAAGPGEAEERYGDFVDVVDEAREELEALRDTYARTLDDESAEEYVAAFGERARRRFPTVALELE